MRWSLKFAAIGLLTVLTTAPVQAATREADQVAMWRSQLRQAYCAEDWNEALSVAAAIMGSDILPYERVWLFLLRQDMFNYQSGVAQFSGCEGGRIMAGVTGDEAGLAASTASLDWSRGFSSLQIGTSSSANRSPSFNTQRGSASASITTTSNTANDSACNPRSQEERRVANGSISNLWNYEIWENSSRQFYVMYWDQTQSCSRTARTTSSYQTQNEAWQEFMRAVDGFQQV